MAYPFTELPDYTETDRTRYNSPGQAISPNHKTPPDNIQYSQAADLNFVSSIRTPSPSMRVAADQCLRSRGYRDFHTTYVAIPSDDSQLIEGTGAPN
jgi:hypothetical protein